LEEYQPQTTYVISFDTTLRNYAGVFLGESLKVSFTTPPFGVAVTTPRSNATGAPRKKDISIGFNAKVDTSTTRRSFKIVPEVPGFLIYNDRPGWPYSEPGLFLLPADSLEPFTTYSVTIDTSLRSRGGAKMVMPYTFSFTTGGQ
jgi:hypothetical protein